MKHPKIARNTPRPVEIIPGINPYADGSVTINFGQTKVHITAFFEESVPRWLKGSNSGWVTAEYAMLPGATHSRGKRERKSISGRSQEIQRLIGRSLRSVVDLEALGERSLVVDCDVIVADGGTRTASISGAYVAMVLAMKKLVERGELSTLPLREAVAALSVGINPDGEILADLDYQEDSSCHTDMNIVLTESGQFVEIQGTAEKSPFSGEQLNALIECAHKALKNVFEAQKKALETSPC